MNNKIVDLDNFKKFKLLVIGPTPQPFKLDNRFIRCKVNICVRKDRKEHVKKFIVF